MIGYIVVADGIDMLDKEQLIVDHIPLVRKIAGRLHKNFSMDNYDALFSDGCYGLVKAANRYDASKNASFTTYVRYRIVGEIQDGLRKSNVVHDRRHNNNIDIVYDYPLEMMADANTILDDLDHKLKKDMVLSRLFTLDVEHEYKLRFYLYYFCHVSSKDIAILFDKTRTAITISNSNILTKLTSIFDNIDSLEDSFDNRGETG